MDTYKTRNTGCNTCKYKARVIEQSTNVAEWGKKDVLERMPLNNG